MTHEQKKIEYVAKRDSGLRRKNSVSFKGRCSIRYLQKNFTSNLSSLASQIPPKITKMSPGGCPTLAQSFDYYSLHSCSKRFNRHAPSAVKTFVSLASSVQPPKVDFASPFSILYLHGHSKPLEDFRTQQKKERIDENEALGANSTPPPTRDPHRITHPQIVRNSQQSGNTQQRSAVRGSTNRAATAACNTNSMIVFGSPRNATWASSCPAIQIWLSMAQARGARQALLTLKKGSW